MIPRYLLVIAAGLLLSLAAAGAADLSRDSRRPSAAEENAFIPLICRDPIIREGMRHCPDLIGYPKGYHRSPGDDTLVLTAIFYGRLTEDGGEQAYLSYGSAIAPHARDFTGGILFERQGGEWQLVRWYPDNEMTDCVAIPGKGQQSMLCLSVSQEQKTKSSEVDAESVNDYIVQLYDIVAAAEDIRDIEGAEEFVCRDGAAPQPLLLSIDALRRSSRPGLFAEASIGYATPEAVREACTHRNFAEMRKTSGQISFGIREGKVVVKGWAGATDLGSVIPLAGARSGRTWLRQHGGDTILSFTPPHRPTRHLTLAKGGAPHSLMAARLIGEIEGKVLLLSDSYASNPYNATGQCGAGEEASLQVIALTGSTLRETFAMPIASCWMSLDLKPCWDGTKRILSLRNQGADETAPREGLYRVAEDGTVTPLSSPYDGKECRIDP